MLITHHSQDELLKMWTFNGLMKYLWIHMYYEREPPVCNPEETAKVEVIQRPKLMRQFARIDNMTGSV